MSIRQKLAYELNMNHQAIILMLGLSLLGCRVDQGGQSLSAYDNLPGNLFVSLAHPYDLDNDDYELVVSAPLEAANLAVCTIDEATGECGVESLSRHIFSSNERKFYVADKSVLLEHGLTLALIAKDDDENIIDLRAFAFVNNQDPTPGAGGSASSRNGSAQSGSDAATVERNTCAVAGCHNNYRSFPAAQKAEALRSGRMPKGRPISAEDKDTLLRYFSGG